MRDLELLTRLATLARLPRSGWVMAGIPEPESVASHSQSVALVALVLGPRVEPALNVQHALALAVVHDTPEALMGDLAIITAELLPEGAKAIGEARAAERLFADEAPEALDLWREYQAGLTREARFVHVCDKLQLGVQALCYQRSGARGLGEFVEGLRGLDAGEFAPCQGLKDALLATLDGDSPAPEPTR